MYIVPIDKRAKLFEAFKQGKTLREAARIAGVAKGTAFRWKCEWGGTIYFREEHGVKFKMNRFK